jgi:dTDP-glucose 4,6-dehydratase
VTLTNCSNNYGPRQFPEKLVPLVILNALGGRPIPIYGDGRQVRDWLHVTDHCEAVREVLLHGRPGATYHVAGDNQTTNLDVVRRLCAILDEIVPDSPHVPHAGLIRFVEDRPGHDRRYALDLSRIRQDLGWRPAHSLESGLRATVEWYLENPGWVRSIHERPEYRAWIERNYAHRRQASLDASIPPGAP